MTISNTNYKAAQDWDTKRYQSKHSYVWQFGSQLTELLNVKPGEQILDLGCGTGELTKQIQDLGATAIGIDSDPQMISKAKGQYPDIEFRHDDARSFSVSQPVDKIFSNAALHWVKEAEQAIKCISSALKSGGMFVAEFGGKNNVGTIVSFLEQSLGKDKNPWFFPGILDYTHLLESNGFQVTFAHLYDRPTPLDGEEGLRNWILMFGQAFLKGLNSNEIKEVLGEAEKNLRSSLYRNNRWIADYRRLRVIAYKK